MAEQKHAVICNVPLDYAFRYITDYRQLPEWLLGVHAFAPTGAQSEHVGAEFAGEMNLGPISVKPLLTYTEWEENSLFSAKFTKGLEGDISMTFEPISDSATRISVNINYTGVGQGVVSKILEKAFQAFLPVCLHYIDTNLNKKISQSYSSSINNELPS